MLRAHVCIIGVTVHFIGERDTDNDGPINAQESIASAPMKTRGRTSTSTSIYTTRYLGLTKSWCIDRKKYEDKEKALILFH